MLSVIWNVLLRYPILSAPPIHGLMIIGESILLYYFFAFFDLGVWKKTRLRTIRGEKTSLESYGRAFGMASKNNVIMWLSVIGLSFISSGFVDFTGGYALLGIPRKSLPLLPPTLMTWLFQTILLFIVLDLVLYCLHWVLHTRFFYSKFHYVHHEFNNTIALHAMCAHSLETFIQSMVIFGVSMVLYGLNLTHPLTIYLSTFMLTLHGIVEHSGYEDGIEWISGGLFGGSPMHFVHHQKPECNYGFYTTIWDRLFGTLKTHDEMISEVPSKESEALKELKHVKRAQ